MPQGFKKMAEDMATARPARAKLIATKDAITPVSPARVLPPL